MIIYLAGDIFGREPFAAVDYKLNRLDTFWDVYNKKNPVKDISLFNRYILDSGAFTFMQAAKKGKHLKVNIDEFTTEYIDYIKHFKIDHFFEMDVDSVLGYEKVKQLRQRIESRTGKQCIPVFHKERGLDEWSGMVKDYGYVALGLSGKDVGKGDYKTFLRFVLDARDHGCKVHGLGITATSSLTNVPFYSVDSSSWTWGNRFGYFFKFDGREMKMLPKPQGKVIADPKALAIHNLRQWVRLADSMETKIIL